jgi:hypothetical protein
MLKVIDKGKLIIYNINNLRKDVSQMPPVSNTPVVNTVVFYPPTPFSSVIREVIRYLPLAIVLPIFLPDSSYDDQIQVIVDFLSNQVFTTYSKNRVCNILIPFDWLNDINKKDRKSLVKKLFDIFHQRGVRLFTYKDVSCLEIKFEICQIVFMSNGFIEFDSPLREFS